MDDNSGSTPNPLNPNITPPVEPKPPVAQRPIPAAPAAPVADTPKPEPRAAEPLHPESSSDASQTSSQEIPEIQGIDPTARPMQKAPTEPVQPVKKKKTGLIIGAIICLFVTIGCAVTAALLLLAPKTDPVASALNKLLTNTNSINTAAKGTINLVLNDPEYPFSNLSINFDASHIGNSPVNSVDATLVASMRDGDEQVTVELNEMYTDSGDLYINIGGLADAIDAIYTRQSIVNDDSSVVETTNESIIAPFASVFEQIDGEWLRISNDELSSITENSDQNNLLACASTLAGSIKSNNNSLTKAYQDNPFIISSDQDINIASKANPIYQLNFDENKLSSFLSATNELSIVDDFTNCLGYEGATLDSQNIINAVKSLPDIFVEVSKDYDFTRVYFATTVTEAKVDVTVDVELLYPSTINITEPVEYQDLSTFVQEMSAGSTDAAVNESAQPVEPNN